MKWDEMSARERDALIAEKVMGWTCVEKRLSSAWGKPPEFEKSDPVVCVPDYSSRISDAWEVVRAMYSDVWDVQIESDEDVWSCTFSRPTGEGAGAYATNECEPICKAALKLHGVDIE